MLVERICASIADTFAFRRAAAWRFVGESEELVPVACAGSLALDSLRGRWLSLSDWPLVEAAVARREAVLAEDAGAGRAVPEEVVRELSLSSLVVAPLFAGERCVGFLVADRAGERFRLEQDELDRLTAACAVAGVVLEGALEYEQLERVSELKSHFIALASHELRTPFAVVHGIVTTLQHRGDGLPPEQRQRLRDMLYEQSERMRQLVDQLLDLSRLEANTIPLEQHTFPIRGRVEGLVAMVAGERAAEVEIDVPPDLEAVADPTAFDRILANLVANAFRHGETPVRITAAQRDRHFRLSVEDSGRGVAPEFVPRLFERFARSDPNEATGRDRKSVV